MVQLKWQLSDCGCLIILSQTIYDAIQMHFNAYSASVKEERFNDKEMQGNHKNLLMLVTICIYT